MNELIDILNENEEWLMERILAYATVHDYTKYTSTLKEAWRLSISGLTRSITDEIGHHRTDISLNPDASFADDPVARFGITEARRHRERGIDIGMFLGLLKYYRRTYKELIAAAEADSSAKNLWDQFIEQCFDQIEIGLCSEWTKVPAAELIAQLQTRNREMTNEKNKYLTVFESQQDPIILLDRHNRIDNINKSAAELFLKSSEPGAQYYYLLEESYQRSEESGSEQDLEFFRHVAIEKLLPWLASEIRDFKADPHVKTRFEKVIAISGSDRYFSVKLSGMLDISKKYKGTIIHIEDRTLLRNAEKEREKLIADLKKALTEVRRLSGLLPICSFCKKIRDDKGYWSQLESYISEHSDAQFSHGLCPECLKEHYPEFVKKG